MNFDPDDSRLPERGLSPPRHAPFVSQVVEPLGGGGVTGRVGPNSRGGCVCACAVSICTMSSIHREAFVPSCLAGPPSRLNPLLATVQVRPECRKCLCRAAGSGPPFPDVTSCSWRCLGIAGTGLTGGGGKWGAAGATSLPKSPSLWLAGALGLGGPFGSVSPPPPNPLETFLHCQGQAKL